MNTDQVEGKWKQLKGNIQAKWGKITDDEVDQIDGNSTALSGKLQEKYGLAKTEADREADKMLESH